MPGSDRGGLERRAGGFPLAGVALTLAGVALMALLVLAIEPLRSGLGDALQGDTASLRDDLRGLGAGGALVVLALALAHTVVWYPTEILDAATGYVYGFWVALPLLMGAWLVSGVVCYLVGRYAARPFLMRWLGERFHRYERAVQRGGVTLLLGMRLVPILPFSLFSYAAGSAQVPMWRFVWTTLVGYLPITAIFAYLGSRLEELSFDDPLLWIGAAVMLALLFLTRGVIRRLGIGSELERS